MDLYIDTMKCLSDTGQQDCLHNFITEDKADHMYAIRVNGRALFRVIRIEGGRGTEERYTQPLKDSISEFYGVHTCPEFAIPKNHKQL